MKLPTLAIAACAILFATAVHATPVAVGALSRDAGSTAITDTLNKRSWLGFESAAGMTYEQVSTALSTGGKFAGYSLATNVDAQKLVDAMGTTTCTATDSAVCLLSTSVDYASFLGLNYGTASYAFFANTSGGQQTGYMYATPTTMMMGEPGYGIAKHSSAFSFAQASTYTTGLGLGWLLYKDDAVNAVPEPGSMALALAGLLAAGAARRRKKA